MSPPPAHDRNQSTTASSRRRVLRASSALVAGSLGVATFSGQVAAHFPPGVEIDIVPGSDENPIVRNRYGVVPVAVLRTDEFDPTAETVRYRFGAPDVVKDRLGARPMFDGHPVDVTGDGTDDLLLLFRTDETGFDGDETEGRIEWERDESGEHGLSGTDSVTIIG